MELLHSKGRQAVKLEDLFLERRDRDDPDLVAVTFDDAYESVYSNAFPIMERHGFPGTVFVVVERVGSTFTWAHERACGRERTFMTWNQIRELADAGWSVGSHTMTHWSLWKRNDEQLRTELEKSRKRIEDEIGRPVQTVSYPYGHVDDRVIAAAREAGYKVGVALRTAHAGPLCVPRQEVKRGTGMLRFRLKLLRSS
jgi:peptidoglycan/xylan/chitin deacetylase (PgdA/CDA1 family)